MLCPLCAHELEPVERQGVEIDHCPDCGGFWLDKGELDLLIHREAAFALEEGQKRLDEARRHREYDVAYSHGWDSPVTSAEVRYDTARMTKFSTAR
jgi:Zn-finger nucleic acid-binding protein